MSEIALISARIDETAAKKKGNKSAKIALIVTLPNKFCLLYR
jgi:hypothetical protein